MPPLVRKGYLAHKKQVFKGYRAHKKNRAARTLGHSDALTLMIPRVESQRIAIQCDSNNHFTQMCCGTEAGSYLRRIDSCITQLKAQGPSRTCNESKAEERDSNDARASPCADTPSSQFKNNYFAEL